MSIVPHTHWDREWYSPFQEYRLRLVKVMDELLEILSTDPTFTFFLFDGQTAMVDDYLEVRPDQSTLISQLTGQGRVAAGPWTALPDEFMVSGETLIHNLQFGIRRAEELGGCLEVGYLPDMFGHIAQMPQILRLSGLGHAIVWRGVPLVIDRTAFRWCAPDGSEVRAEYLWGSYSNGRELPDDPAQLIARARNYALEVGSANMGELLLMNGTDHQPPHRHLPGLVNDANALSDEFQFVIESPAQYLDRQSSEGLPTWNGELRSGARANLLMGVASNRVDVHQAAAAAERAVEGSGEILSALFGGALGPRPLHHQHLLEIAWRNLILNSAHDSACACSADEVVDQVLVRYYEARQIGEGIASEALACLAAGINTPENSLVVVNPCGDSRDGLVEVSVPGTGPVHFIDDAGDAIATQEISTTPGREFSATVIGRKIGWIIEEMRGSEFAGSRIGSVDIDQHSDGSIDVTLHGALPDAQGCDLTSLREELGVLSETDRTFRIRMLPAPMRTALVHVKDVGGHGWRTLRSIEGPGPTGPVATGEGILKNEFLRVEISAIDGTLHIETIDGISISGANRYIEGGDGGDTYNYSPPAQDLKIDTPERVMISTLESGPLRGTVLVEADYLWPNSGIGNDRNCSSRSEETRLTTIRTSVQLRAGERFVRIHGEFDNECRDHRLRAHFPLPALVSGSDAECAFTVVHRGLEAEGGPHEIGLPTFPSRRFVSVTDGSLGVALLHDGLLEYEVVEGGTELAITLLRGTGYLSRYEPSLRPGPAGPANPLNGAQVLGQRHFDFAIYPHRGNWDSANCAGLSDDFLMPLQHCQGGGAGGTLPEANSALEVIGARISAIHRDGYGIVVRIVNFSPNPSVARLVACGQLFGYLTGTIIDLRGRELDSFDGGLAMRPWEIATIRLAPTA